MYQDGPGPVGRKNVRYVRWNQPLLGSPYNSGGARSPARFAPPRGRGGDRSVPRGCPEPAAPLGPAGGAGSAHPLRTRRLGRGARRGAGPPTCLRRSNTEEGRVCAPFCGGSIAPTRSFVRRGRWGKRVPDTLYRNAPSSKSTGRPQKSEKSFALATNASRRRSDRACPSLEEAEAFSAMKLRPFPARISETVRNIDRAR